MLQHPVDGRALQHFGRQRSDLCSIKNTVHSVDILLGAVSTDENYIRELDIMFSKEWSENMSNIFMTYFCFHPSSRAVAHCPVNRKSLCDFRWYSLYGYIIKCRRISPQAGRVNITFMVTSRKYTIIKGLITIF
jgi:hypothetical protein